MLMTKATCVLGLLAFALAGKTTLLYNHLPKTGGSEIRESIAIAFNQKGSAISSSTITVELTQNQTLQNQWLLLSEAQSIDVDKKRADHFIIGSIREPCSYYVSLWAYRSAKKVPIGPVTATPEEKKAELAKYYGSFEPFDTQEDAVRFGRWVRDIASNATDPRFPTGMGMLSSRVMNSYQSTNTTFAADQIDCWVRTQTLHADLDKCLVQFMSQGGTVPFYDKYLVSRKVPNRSKNRSHHKGCSFYFENEVLRSVVRKADDFTYSAFNMSSCCE